MNGRILTEYTVHSPKVTNPLKLALVADLHDGPFEDVLPVLRRCDAVLILGDLVDRHAKGPGYMNALRFLDAAPECAPTFYAIGNHEVRLPRRDAYWPLVEKSRAHVLDDRWVRFGGIVLGAMSSRLHNQVDSRVVDEMAREPGFRLLICHQPEHYARHVAGKGIDLTLSGHAHGGQVNLWGRGVYSPGQGLFPRLTAGFYDEGRLLVSRGIYNPTWAPRWGNPCELIILHLKPEGNT